MDHLTATPFRGLDGVVATRTTLSHVDGEGGRLILRGHRLEDIAGRHGWEWIAAELWRDLLAPGLTEASLRAEIGPARVAAFAAIAPLLDQAARLAPLEALRLLLASVPDAPEAGLAARLAATLCVGLAAVLRRQDGAEPVPPDPALAQAADFLRMLHARPPAPAEVRALDTYLLVAAEHGLNASTFTARVVASTHAGTASAATAALCALKGPLHGGAPGPVLDMIDAIGTPENAEAWLTRAVSGGERLMGFGHKLYRSRDPRAEVVKAAVAELSPDTGRLRFAEAVEQAALEVLRRHKPDRKLPTNLEFYTALLLEALGIPRAAFTGVFAIGRIAGWVAHATEQVRDGRLIRPLSEYVGP
jgi:citrate synthase